MYENDTEKAEMSNEKSKKQRGGLKLKRILLRGYGGEERGERYTSLFATFFLNSDISLLRV
jgi:hypothetical protein|tara:strand:- start:857 stop:1039 length:183 start_codon:yes stop_codon:yes gene_type:complete